MIDLIEKERLKFCLIYFRTVPCAICGIVGVVDRAFNSKILRYAVRQYFQRCRFAHCPAAKHKAVTLAAADRDILTAGQGNTEIIPLSL